MRWVVRYSLFEKAPQHNKSGEMWALNIDERFLPIALCYHVGVHLIPSLQKLSLNQLNGLFWKRGSRGGFFLPINPALSSCQEDCRVLLVHGQALRFAAGAEHVHHLA